jgi:co-chaperonin GroES (HSP10)
MTKILAQGDYIILEKVDYEKEEITDSGLIIKKSQILDSSSVEAKIVSMGNGTPDASGNIPSVNYEVGNTILYDASSRIGVHANFDIIKREHVLAVVFENETE